MLRDQSSPYIRESCSSHAMMEFTVSKFAVVTVVYPELGLPSIQILERIVVGHSGSLRLEASFTSKELPLNMGASYNSYGIIRDLLSPPLSLPESVRIVLSAPSLE